MKRLIIEKDPKLAEKVKPKHKTGSPLAWFAFGMMILYATMAFLKYSTLVPKSNFWVKSIDCQDPSKQEICSY